MKLPILAMVKNVMLGPVCPLCSKRKSILFKGKHYCPNCERHILEFEVSKGL